MNEQITRVYIQKKKWRHRFWWRKNKCRRSNEWYLNNDLFSPLIACTLQNRRILCGGMHRTPPRGECDTRNNGTQKALETAGIRKNGFRGRNGVRKKTHSSDLLWLQLSLRTFHFGFLSHEYLRPPAPLSPHIKESGSVTFQKDKTESEGTKKKKNFPISDIGNVPKILSFLFFYETFYFEGGRNSVRKPFFSIFFCVLL